MAKRTPGFSIAVAGVTGAVGEVLLRVLEERSFPVSELRLLASERSRGTRVRFGGRDHPVEPVRPDSFDGIDFAFFAATGALSRELAPEVVRRGGIAIDKSNTWRMDPQVPLVVPEVNGAAVEKHSGILASPNCTTMPFVLCLEALRRAAGVRSVVVTTFQSVSGAGKPGLEELERQVDEARRGAPPSRRTFAAPIAFNVVPLCETFREDGYTTEEVKLRDETRKIMDLPRLEVSMTCVRVPVRVGHSMAVLVETERSLSADAARAALASFPGVRLMDDPAHDVVPTAADAEGIDDVLVGRVRRDLSSERLWFWCVGDNLRKGAATNAVQIAEELIARGLR